MRIATAAAKMSTSGETSSSPSRVSSDFSTTSGDMSDASETSKMASSSVASTSASSASYNSAMTADTVKLAPDDNSLTSAAIDKLHKIKLSVDAADKPNLLSETEIIQASRDRIAAKTRATVEKRLAVLTKEKRDQLLALLSPEEILRIGGESVNDEEATAVKSMNFNTESSTLAHFTAPIPEQGASLDDYGQHHLRSKYHCSAERNHESSISPFDFRANSIAGLSVENSGLDHNYSSAAQFDSQFEWIKKQTRLAKHLRRDYKYSQAPPPAIFYGNKNANYTASGFLEAFLCHTSGVRTGSLNYVFHLEIINFLGGVAREWYKMKGYLIDHWDTFCREFLVVFRGSTSDQAVRDKIKRRIQRPNETFITYLCDMNLLFNELLYSLSELEKLNMVLSNLNPRYKNCIRHQRFFAIHELIDAMMGVEHMVSEDQRWFNEQNRDFSDDWDDRTFSNSRPRRPERADNRLRDFQQPRQQQQPEPPRTRDPAPQQQRENRLADRPQHAQTSRAPGECFTCGEAGHFSRECPRRSQGNRNAPPRNAQQHATDRKVEITKADSESDARAPLNPNAPPSFNPIILTDEPAKMFNINDPKTWAFDFDEAVPPEITMLLNDHNYDSDSSQNAFPSVYMVDKNENENNTDILNDEFRQLANLPSARVEVSLYGKRYKALLDSGASGCVGNRDILELAERNGIKAESDRRVFGLAQGFSTSTKVLRVKLAIPGLEKGVTQKFFIFPEMSHELVLGRDFLFNHGISISVKRSTYYFEREPDTHYSFSPYNQIMSIKVEPPWVKGCLVDVPPKYQFELRNILLEFNAAGLFSKEAGLVRDYWHEINTGTNKPMRCPARPLNPAKRGIMEKCIDDLLSAGVIAPCEGVCPWGSPPVLVKKQKKHSDEEQKYRLCLDTRVLNSRTIFTCSTVQKMSDIFEAMGGSNYFTLVDLSQSYFNVPIKPSDRPKTCMRTAELGDFHFLRMPFGLVNSSESFVRALEMCLSGLLFKVVTTYVDDICIFSKNESEHLQHVRMVFARLHDYGFHINFDKMQFFQRKVKILGHVVSGESISPCEDKIQALLSYKIPKSREDIQRCLGSFNFYRNFLPNMAEVAQPLTELLKKSTVFRWTEKEQSAFDEMLNLVKNHTMLAIIDYSKPITLKTDASGSGLGAVLLNGVAPDQIPIAYISRVLNIHEKSYCATELEILAIIWATSRWREYLEHVVYTIESDCIAASYLINISNATGRLQRWALRLSSLGGKIVHRPGRTHFIPDALSRAATECDPTPDTHPLSKILPIGDIESEISLSCIPLEADAAHHKCSRCHGPTRELAEIEKAEKLKLSRANKAAEKAAEKAEAASPDFQVVRRRKKTKSPPEEKQTKNKTDEICLISPPVFQKRLPTNWVEWAKEQESDPLLKHIIDGVKVAKPSCVSLGYEINDDGVLIKEGHLIVVPTNQKKWILQLFHDHKLSCHLGVFKTLNKIKDFYFWPKMRSEVYDYIRGCLQCQVAKATNHLPFGLNNSTATAAPGVCWSVDLLGPYIPSKNQYRFIFAVVDTFSKFVTLFPLRNATATACVNALVNQVITFGPPKFLISDQGPSFSSFLWRRVCEQLQITTRFTTSYRPCGNPVERYNRVVKACLITLMRNHKDWDQYLNGIMYALRTSVNETTGMRPDFLTFGRCMTSPFGPAPSMTECPDPKDIDYANYSEIVVNNVRNGIELANICIQKARRRQIENYNKHRLAHNFETGAFVLRKAHTLSNAAKGIVGSLAHKYSSPYVLGKMINKNVFEFENLEGKVLGTTNVDQLKHFHYKPEWAENSEESGESSGQEDDSESAKETSESESDSDIIMPPPLPGIQVPDIANEKFEIDHSELIPELGESSQTRMSLRDRGKLRKPKKLRETE